MARALRVEFEDALYHVCARGNRRERVFASQNDYLRFEQLLSQSIERYQVELHAYVLLPNHFHLNRRSGSYLNILHLALAGRTWV